MSRSALRALPILLAALLLPACVAVGPPPPAAPFTVAPSVVPTAPPQAGALLALLDERDRAHAAGDESRTLALVADGATVPFREREIALARAGGRRRSTPPQRTVLAVNVAGSDARLEVAELDDQGRERRVRYFFSGLPDAVRLSEPAEFGPERTLDFAGGAIRYRAFDEDQAATLAQLAPSTVATLVARLGPEYAPREPLALALRPDAPPELPPFASASVAQGQVTFLTSASMLAASGPGSTWTGILIAHEIAHVLLFQRGNGTFLLNEGIPLWLTDDRRQPELDRLVAADALWTLDHLIDGPRDPGEFFAGYAQAAAFVRFTAERNGERAVTAMWEAGRHVPFADAYREATGVDAAAAHTAWRASLGR